jgi:AraC family transcriptional regulator of adaptative response/methylated-DNA-[protein]-cysteine methyltransferase
MEQAKRHQYYILNILKELQDDPFWKINDYDLVLRGIEPNTIHRWFKRYYGMTFQAYQQKLCINTAFHKVRDGEKFTNIAFDTGFESLSGFNSSYQKIFGHSATKSIDKNVINIIR